MSRETDEKAQKIHNPRAEFDKPSDVVKDPELSQAEKKKALENLEQDAHQLMTASNEAWPRKAIMSLGMSRSLMRWSRPSRGSAKSRNTSQRNKRPVRGAG
jgi:hypothetical protein